MIGHYLLTLDVEQEDRVLTGKMTPFIDSSFYETGEQCLVMLVWGVNHACDLPPNEVHRAGRREDAEWVTNRYDDLGRRFGSERINAAIRNRVLSNRANRALRNAPQLVTP